MDQTRGTVLERSAEIYRDAVPVLLVSLVGGLFAGVFLGGNAMRSAMESVPGLLVMVPAMLATRGNVYGSLGARISTGLHQGLVEPRFEYDERLANAVTASVVNGVSISVLIGLASWLLLPLLGRQPAPLPSLIGISVVAAVLSAVTLTFFLLVVLFAGYRRGLDPDLLIGPIVTTSGDVFGVVYLYVGVLVVDGGLL
ncbi:MAG: magnesium transporter [Halobacteria archaeon]|nr:magnesium transporter [Halobacteria archaeon]